MKGWLGGDLGLEGGWEAAVAAVRWLMGGGWSNSGERGPPSGAWRRWYGALGLGGGLRLVLESGDGAVCGWLWARGGLRACRAQRGGRGGWGLGAIATKELGRRRGGIVGGLGREGGR